MTAYKMTARALSIPVGLLVSVGISLAVTSILSGASAWAILKGILEPEWAGYCAMVVLLASSAAGAAVATGTIQRLRAQMCLAAAGGYYLALLALTAMFFGGQYQGMGVTAAMILCGCVLVILLVPGTQNRAGCRRKKKRR